MEQRHTRTFWLVVFFLGALLLSRYSFTPPQTMDYWFFLAKGKRIAETGLEQLGGPNPFVFTAPSDSRFYDKEWLFEWGLYKLYNATGHAGPVIAKGLLIFFLWFLFLQISRTLGASPWSTLAMFILGLSTVLMTRLSIRPHLVGYVFLMLMFWALLRPPNIARLVGVGVMFVLWANIHGSFVMAGALLGSYGAWSLLAPVVLRRWDAAEAERAAAWRPWWYLLLLLPLLLCINPYGWRLWLVIWAFQKEVSGKPDPFVTPEWVPFQWDNPYALALIVLLVLTLLTWLLRDSRRSTERLGWVTVIAMLGVSNLRFVGLAFLLLGPLLAAQIQNFRSRALQHTFTGAVFALACYFHVQAWQQAPTNQLTANLRGQPEEVLGPLLNTPGIAGRIFTNIHPTAYIAFRLPQRYKTAYDGHTITPGFTAWSQEYKQALLNPRQWDRYCHKHKCNFVLLDLRDQRSLLLAAHLYQHKNWVPIRMTLRWVLYTHRQHAPALLRPYYYEVLRSFYDLGGIVHTHKQANQRTQEFARLRKEPHSQPLVAALRGFLLLHQHKAMPFSARQPLTPARKKHLQQILSLMRQAYQDAPWHPGVNVGLGLALSALQRPGAQRHFLTAMDWNPLWLTPRVALVRYWMQRKQATQANRALQQLLRTRSGYHAWQRLQRIMR